MDELCRVACLRRHIHSAEDLGKNKVRVLATRIAHLTNGLGEERVAVEDSRIFCEKAEDQSREEMVELFPTFSRPSPGCCVAVRRTGGSIARWP